MRRRSEAVRVALARWARAAGAMLGTNVDEIFLIVGLWVVAYALWPRFGREALIVPGVVMIWIGLPSRLALVARLPEQRKGQ